MLHAVTTGTGPAVVLLHGFSQTAGSMGPLAGELAPRHRVVSLDLPGHGRSGPATDLWQSASAVGETGGAASYVGYSLGGRVALHLALAEPDRVERLVLLSATAGIDDPAERAARRASDDELARSIERDGVDAFLARWLALPMFERLPRDAAGLEQRRSNSVEGLAGSLRLAGTGTMDPPLWDRLATLAMPVLVVAGERDTKFVDLGRRLAHTIGDNADLAVVPDAGHAAHLEQPDSFQAILDPFLESAYPENL